MDESSLVRDDPDVQGFPRLIHLVKYQVTRSQLAALDGVTCSKLLPGNTRQDDAVLAVDKPDQAGAIEADIR